MVSKTTEEKYKEAKRKATFAKKSVVLDTKKYVQLPLEERFEKLMYLYDRLCPNWKQDYINVERRKPREVQTELDASKIVDVIDGAIGEDIIEEAYSMFVGNKIAHQSERAERDIIRFFMENKASNGEIRMPIEGSKEEDFFYENIDAFLSENATDDEIEYAKRKLKRYGVTEEILEQLNAEQGDDIRLFSNLNTIGFFIKDFEMEKMISELQKPENDQYYSYGKCSTPKTYSNGSPVIENGEPVMEHRLVVDLPYYGQFCVHMKTEQSISAMSQTRYDKMRMYETKTVLLSDKLSKRAQEYLERKAKNGKCPTLDEIIPDLQVMRETNPRFAHYIALKLGATKTEIAQLYGDTLPDESQPDDERE